MTSTATSCSSASTRIEPADRESKKAALKALSSFWTNSKIAFVLLVDAYKLMPFVG